MGFGGLPRGVLVALTACVVMLVAPAAASAATYYAAPGGKSVACTPGEPCEVQVALSKAKDGEAVSLAGGTYTLPIGGLKITEDIEFGATPSARAVLLTSNTTYGLTIDPGVKARIHDVVINGNVGLNVGREAIAERIFVEFTGISGSGVPPLVGACTLEDGATLRDSVCWARISKEEAKDSTADAILATFGPGCGEGPKQPIVLRNVTAIAATATGHGLRAYAVCNSRLEVNAANVIARSANSADIAAEKNNIGEKTEAHVTISNSSFATVLEEPSKLTISSPTADGNQAQPPLFVEAATGDFRQQPGSPTLDGGLSDAFVGALDAAGAARAQPRCFGGAPIPDIGAYEFSPTEACPVPPPPPPPPPEPRKPTFRILALLLNRKLGTGRVEIEVPAAGTVTLTGSGIKLVRRTAAGAGDTVTLPIQTWAITKVRLKKRGKTRVKVHLVFQPKRGAPEEISRALVLHKTRKARKAHRH